MVLSLMAVSPLPLVADDPAGLDLHHSPAHSVPMAWLCVAIITVVPLQFTSLSR